MPKLQEKKALRMTPNEVRPNCGPATAPAPLQWVLAHQSPLPWINSVTLWPLGEKGTRASE
jgi:hypothetical protein